MRYIFSGTHIICDLYGIKNSLCSNVGSCKFTVENAINQANAHVIETIIYTFDSGGFTLISLLKESHVSIHTYPENNSVFVDAFTCGNADTQKIIDMLINYFQPNKCVSKKLIRGIKNTSS